MDHTFKRAKSKENKTIRLQQILDVTDRLFHEKSYHEITLSVIASEVQLARGGLYKYVTSKEEIFLMIYLQKEKALVDDIIGELKDKKITPELLSEVVSHMIYRHLDFIKYHQILNAIIETNVTIERLAKFKITTFNQTKELFQIFEDNLEMTRSQAFHFYLTIIYHSVYLRDRVAYISNYVKAMKLAKLDIEDIDFEEYLASFILQQLK